MTCWVSMQPAVSKVSGAIFINPQHQKVITNSALSICVINYLPYLCFWFFSQSLSWWIILILNKNHGLLLLSLIVDGSAREFLRAWKLRAGRYYFRLPNNHAFPLFPLVLLTSTVEMFPPLTIHYLLSKEALGSCDSVLAHSEAWGGFRKDLSSDAKRWGLPSWSSG